jgi:membrane protein DedA with SNARE-associated domain
MVWVNNVMVWVNIANIAAIVGWSRSAVLAFVSAKDVPFYSRTEVLIGSAIMLALCLVVLVAWAVVWWRRR